MAITETTSSRTPHGAHKADVEMQRRVEWHDTDAAGHHHGTAIIRWVESAEAELFRSRGLGHLYGRMPRVRHEVDYLSRLFFDQCITVRLFLERLGNTSLAYRFEVHGPDGPAARGRVVAVHCDAETGSASPLPDEVRTALTSTAE
ncbi:thioesterase family protein [Streptomyces sp. NPDC001508]|uniref:acyl-CoA thioesterase n=1 Tax=Streptomyces sp. NPDC001508 TaxID=3154656 RepID=UPI0033265126